MNSIYRNRTSVDDRNFIFLKSGTYPSEYIDLNPALFYPTYFIDEVKSWKNSKNHSNSRFDNWNTDHYQINEYWEIVPDSIRKFGAPYSNIPNGIAVSTFGRIYDTISKTAIPTYRRKDGYLGVFNMIMIHRIILYTFLPITNFNDMTVDHKNYCITDNQLWNLQWLSAKDNIYRSIQSGNRTNPYFKKGIDNARSTMTDYQAELCCMALLTHKYNYDQISKAIGVTKRQVKHIRDCDVHIDICDKYSMQNNNFDYRHLKNNKEYILPLSVAIQE